MIITPVRIYRGDFFAPLTFEILNLWEGFKEVFKFIDGNRGIDWLKKICSL